MDHIAEQSAIHKIVTKHVFKRGHIMKNYKDGANFKWVGLVRVAVFPAS